MLKGQFYSPSFLVCHLSLAKEKRRIFRPSLLNLYRYDAIQLQTNCDYFESLALMRTTFPSRTTTNLPFFFLVFSFRRFRAVKYYYIDH